MLSQHYQHVNIDLVRQVIDLFDWKKVFSNLNVKRQGSLFNETIMNIFEDFIPHETVTCDDKDPPWITKWMKTILKEKKKKHYSDITQRIIQASLSEQLEDSLIQLKNLIESSKVKYLKKISSKLRDLLVSAQDISFLKRLLNEKKKSLYLPILHDNKFIVALKEESKFFNAFFED